MVLRKETRKGLQQGLTVLIVCSILLMSGCAFRRPIVHSIDGEIFSVLKGTNINGTITKSHGWFVTDYYLKEIFKVRIGQ